MTRAMSKDYYRPVPMTDPARRHMALPLAGGWGWFDTVELMRPGQQGKRLAAEDVPEPVLERLTAPRAPICGMNWSRPHLMGILNVTPDSFSDGGRFDAPEAAQAHVKAMTAAGADIIDIGGESTRPGAAEVSTKEEIARTAPVIAALRASGNLTPVSIDTRKSAVAGAALDAGADMINDVAAFTFDAELSYTAAAAKAPVCLMHAQGDPATMQDEPSYDDVLFDVYDFLEARVRAAVAAGIPRERVIVDPGIGFGKTLEHNLRLLQHLSLFHALGCLVLLGASRKRFIGTLSGVEAADQRMPGSISVALHAARQGIQIIRVHDVAETRQALDLFQAVALTRE